MAQANGAGPANDIGVAAKLALLVVPPLSGLAQGGFSALLPSLSAHFAGQPHADMLVRFMVTGLSFAMIFGSLFAAMAAARIGQRRLLIWSLAVFGLAGAAGYVLDNLYALVASRLLLGVATATAGVMAAAVLTSHVAGADRNRWLGFFIVSGTFGALVLLALVGLAGRIEWRAAFLVHLLALPAMLAVIVLIPEVPKPVAPAGDVPRAARGIPIAITLFGMGCGVVLTTALIFLPYHLRAIGHGAPDEITAPLLASALAGGMVSFAYGWLRRRFAIAPIFAAGFLLAGMGLLFAVLSGSFVGAIAGMGLMGAGVGLVAPNLFAASALASDPEERARTIGFVRAGGYAAPLMAQIPLEPVARAYGPDGALYVVAGFAFVMILVSLAGRRMFAAR